jgi:site-specific DNA recombinase
MRTIQGSSSMDAQFEACYDYIAVRHPVSGLPTTASYADAGFSGGPLDRPALQRMLADIESDRIDLVVVHKIDRLSRSLVHFVQLMEIFERHHVTLVAVTQHLNSHDAAGRMAIHALMSFAQFEREATGERIRDKMRATRRQGLWSGNITPLGYAAQGQRLEIIEQEAQQVRHIFERFVALGSATDLVRELGAQGRTTKAWITKAGKPRGGKPIDKNYLYKLLNNRTLLGEIKAGDVWLPGAHAPIVSRDLWDQAHALITARQRPRKHRSRERQDFLLKGKVFGADGRAYSPWCSSLRNNRVYAYYVPQRNIAEGAAGSALPRCPAFELESVVIEHLRGQMRAPIPVIEQLPPSFRQDPLFSLDAACAALKDLEAAWELFFSQIQRTLLVRMIDRVTVSAESISIRLDPDGIAQVLRDLLGNRSGKRS